MGDVILSLKNIPLTVDLCHTFVFVFLKYSSVDIGCLISLQVFIHPSPQGGTSRVWTRGVHYCLLYKYLIYSSSLTLNF